MKNIFTEEQLKTGMFIIRNDAGRPITDQSFARTVTFKIIYRHTAEKPHGMCSVLTDGFTYGVANDRKELAEYLNNDDIGFRPLEREEMIELIKTNTQNFY
jgi:hypothetical protein